jgi:heme/copper-type cytochrome/quinol oxidase subunit 2
MGGPDAAENPNGAPMTLATLIAFAAEESGKGGNVMLETIVFPIIAIVVFGTLALVTLSYRNVANRHAHKAEAYAKAHASDLQQTGHGH